MTGFALHDFTVTLRRRRLLQIDRLDLPAGGFVGVVGPNGAGKSTFLRALAGLLPHAGDKRLDGGWPEARRIGYLPQNFAVQAALSVTECVLLGRREELRWRITAQDRAVVDRALARFGLAHLAKRRMDALSGGQQQLVLLAQRISRAPRLLILDEPTSALDLHHQIEALTHLKQIAEDGVLVVAALHDLTLAGRFADRLVLIDAGRLHASGPARQVLSQPVLDPVYRITSEYLLDRGGNPVIVPHRREPA